MASGGCSSPWSWAYRVPDVVGQPRSPRPCSAAAIYGAAFSNNSCRTRVLGGGGALASVRRRVRPRPKQASGRGGRLGKTRAASVFQLAQAGAKSEPWRVGERPSVSGRIIRQKYARCSLPAPPAAPARHSSGATSSLSLCCALFSRARTRNETRTIEKWPRSPAYYKLE